MVDNMKRNHVITLPQIKVSSVMRVSHAGTDTIPIRHRIASRMTAAIKTRAGPWARIDAAPILKSTPTSKTMTASAMEIANSQSRSSR